jgi:hypothetical protein
MRTLVAVLAVAFSGATLPAISSQLPTTMPMEFEFQYQVGPHDGNTVLVAPEHHDAFDSERKERVLDTAGGPVRYTAGLRDDERAKIYSAIVQNQLFFHMKTDFTSLGRTPRIPRGLVGRLRIVIDGSVRQFYFDEEFGALVPGDQEWWRLQSVLHVIDGILMDKDSQQTPPARSLYPPFL